MGLAITAAVIFVLCLIAAGPAKPAEQGDVIALQNRLEASRDSQLHDDHGHFVPDSAEDRTSEDFINLEQHWNP